MSIDNSLVHCMDKPSRYLAISCNTRKWLLLLLLLQTQSLTLELQPVHPPQVHLHPRPPSWSRGGGALKGSLQVGPPAGHLHDWLHQDAPLAAPHWPLAAAVVIHCTPGPPVYPRLQQHHERGGSVCTLCSCYCANWVLAAAVVVHCTPGPPVHPRLQHHQPQG